MLDVFAVYFIDGIFRTVILAVSEKTSRNTELGGLLMVRIFTIFVIAI